MMSVFVEPARSAEPPISPGAIPARTLRAVPEAARVAIDSPAIPSGDRCTGSGA